MRPSPPSSGAARRGRRSRARSGRAATGSPTRSRVRHINRLITGGADESWLGFTKRRFVPQDPRTRPQSRLRVRLGRARGDSARPLPRLRRVRHLGGGARRREGAGRRERARRADRLPPGRPEQAGATSRHLRPRDRCACPPPHRGARAPGRPDRRVSASGRAPRRQRVHRPGQVPVARQDARR